MKQKNLTLFKILFIGLLLSACSPSLDQDTAKDTGYQVIDQAGITVNIDQPIERVISSHGPTTTFVYVVGAQDKLIAAGYLGVKSPKVRETLQAIDPEFENIQANELFNLQTFNIEEGAKREPDLILANVKAQWRETVQTLDVPVVVFDAETAETLVEAVRLTGKIFGTEYEQRAEEWVDLFNHVTETIENDLSTVDQDEVKVLFTGSDVLQSASGEMYQSYIIEAAGGIHVASDLTGFWNTVDIEQIALWDPDVIIIPSYGGTKLEQILDNPEWQILEAVQNGKVYQMPTVVAPWDTPTPDSVLGIIWLAEILYPEIASLDCTQETSDYFESFYGHTLGQEELQALCGKQ